MRILKPSLGNTNTSFNATDSLSADAGNSNGNSLQQAYGRASSGTLTKGSNAPTPSSTEYDDALAQLARQGNYDAYWKKATQNANINRLAQKYVGNTLKQQGLESTGEGTLGSTSLSNAYINAQANALSDFNTQEQTIGENAYTRYQNQQSESASKVSSYESNMSTALNNNTLEDWYTKNVVNNADLTDTEKAELARYYEAINSGDSTKVSTPNGSMSIEEYATANNLRGGWTSTSRWSGMEASDGTGLTCIRDGEVINAGDNNGVRNELVKMNNTKSNYTEPTIFNLVNADGKASCWVLYDPYSGKFYQIDENIASGDLKKYATYRIQGSGDAYQIRSAS